MILLLDTTVLIDALRLRNGRREFLAQMVRSGNGLATTAINVGEVYAGMRAGEGAKTEMFVSGLDCYDITAAVARRAGDLRSDWSRQGRTLSLADVMIAAVALEHSLTLVTDNRKDFPMAQLEFIALP